MIVIAAVICCFIEKETGVVLFFIALLPALGIIFANQYRDKERARFFAEEKCLKKASQKAFSKEMNTLNNREIAESRFCR